MMLAFLRASHNQVCFDIFMVIKHDSKRYSEEGDMPERNTNNKPRFRSTEGQIVEGSLVETERFIEVRVQEGNSSKPVRAYAKKPDQQKQLRDAVSNGEPILARGVLLGSNQKGNVHIAVNSINEPLVLEGRVSHVRHSSPEKKPFVAGYIVHKVRDGEGNTYNIGKGFQAFGEAAKSLSGLKQGDTIYGGAREIVQRYEKNGEVIYKEALQIVGPASIGEPSLDKKDNSLDLSEQESPYPADMGDDPEQQAPANDFDDEIPF